MPTITCSYKDLQSLVKRQIPELKLRELLHGAKADVEQIHGDELLINCGDTNLPYLWSVEGIARFLRFSLNITEGVQKLKLEKSQFSVIADTSVNSIRPHIACFVAKGPALSEALLVQLIQLQEKLSESFGRKRSKVSIGLYPFTKIQFPIMYKAVDPTAVRFVPLDERSELNLNQILQRHPKGMQYSNLLAKAKRYPVLMDSTKQILSFPPIINSEKTGKLEPGATEIFFDATGTDQSCVSLVTSIVAFALADRGFKIFPCIIKSGRQNLMYPIVEPWKHHFDEKIVEKVAGIALRKKELKTLLQKAGYDYTAPFVIIPAYRKDILHDVDIVEDIVIAYGYENIDSLQLQTSTPGKSLRNSQFFYNARIILVGLGFQECLSAMLSNKNILYENMLCSKNNCVEIENPVSGLYDVLRSWLTPILLEVLAKNKHVALPQRIFEQGIVVKNENGFCEDVCIAAVTTHASADYTGARQDAEFLLRKLGIHYTLVEEDYSWAIPGRSAKIVVSNNACGIIGEIHPEVLKKFGIEHPVNFFELSLSTIENTQ